jgi:D-alanyl-D-alanine carboxypeptidase/D-alanyl-D-alanine-endopeptidase (penicillin-binding protein 4)
MAPPIIKITIRNTQSITKIKGPIIVDQSLFDEKLYDESRQSVRVDRAYDAPVSAASFNWNSVNVYVRPGASGSLSKVFLDPESDYFILSNQVQTVSGSSADIQISVEKDGSRERVIVRGKIGNKSSEIVKFASIQSPVPWLGANLVSFLKQRGVSVEDTSVKAGEPPSSARIVAKSQGWSLFELVDGMMKYSNNFIAEMLTKQLAAQAGIKKS